VLLVLRAGVLAGRNRGGRRDLGEVVEATERLVQVEDDGLVVRRVDRRVVLTLARVRALVALEVEEVVEVRRAVDQRRLLQRTRHTVFDVLRRDRGAVLELHTLTQLVRPGLAAVAGHAQAFGEVTGQLAAGLARADLEHGQRTGVQASQVPRQTVVGVARVDRVPVRRNRHLQRSALLVRRVEHLAVGGVERGGGGATAGVVGGGISAPAATGGEREGGCDANGDASHHPSLHLLLPFG
jgi:hypothetical protein